MADETIGEAARETAEGGGAVALAPNPAAEVEEHVPEAKVDEARHETEQAADAGYLTRAEADRILRRLDALESGHARLTEQSSRYAASDHGHPHDPSVQTLIDALKELDSEEQRPERRRWWQRKIGGK